MAGNRLKTMRAPSIGAPMPQKENGTATQGEKLLPQFRIALLLVITGLSIAVSALLLGPFIRAIAWASLMTAIAYPMHRWVARRVREPNTAATISCTLFGIAVIVPGGLLGQRVVQEAGNGLRQIQTFIERGFSPGWDRLLNQPLPEDIRRWIEHFIGPLRIDPQAILRQALGLVGSLLARNSVHTAGDLLWGSVQLLIIVFTFFFLIRDAERILPAIQQYLPLDPGETHVLLQRISDAFHATVNGSVVAAVVEGLLGGVAFWAVGAPSPLLWGAVMAATCLVPLLGAPVIWIPIALILALQGAYWKALALALWGMLVIHTADHVIRSVVVGARAQLHPMIALLGALGGVMLMGAVGLLVGPVLLVISLALIEILFPQLRTTAAVALPGITRVEGTDLPDDQHGAVSMVEHSV
ncbi:MAG TPA: AI-2E family transporter [Armatimonadota bacterium]|nr:AI-2E family transporter [Armatimonadota bacterium]